MTDIQAAVSRTDYRRQDRTVSDEIRLTEAEKSCRREGYCVFTIGAQRCTMCGRDREGNR